MLGTSIKKCFSWISDSIFLQKPLLEGFKKTWSTSRLRGGGGIVTTSVYIEKAMDDWMMQKLVHNRPNRQFDSITDQQIHFYSS